MTRILAIALAVVLGVTGILGWQLKSSLKREGAATVALDAATKANKTNLDTISRLEGDAVIAQAVAMADALAREKADGQRDELVKAAREAPPCGGLDAILDARRRQLEGQQQ